MKKMYNVRYGVQKIRTKADHFGAMAALTITGLAAAVALPLAAHAATSTVVVSPGNMQGWAFFDDNGNGGSGSLVAGPGTPPLGMGSAQLSVNASNQGYALGGTSNGGTKLADLTAVSYSTYVQQGNNTIAPALQFNVDSDVTDANNAFQGRLVYEPYQNGTVTDGQWQNWNALPGVWWLSHSTSQFGGNCGQASPCTFAQLEALYPNIGILNGTGNVVFKAGSGWNVPFVGNVDDLTLGTSANTTTYDLEPYVVATDKAACKDNGWQNLADANGNAFKNQGDCVSYVASGGKSQH